MIITRKFICMSELNKLQSGYVELKVEMKTGSGLSHSYPCSRQGLHTPMYRYIYIYIYIYIYTSHPLSVKVQHSLFILSVQIMKYAHVLLGNLYFKTYNSMEIEDIIRESFCLMT